MVNVKNLATDKQKDRRKSFVKKLVDNMVKFTIAANDAFVRSIQSIDTKVLAQLLQKLLIIVLKPMHPRYR